MPGEFDLIRRYFGRRATGVVLGAGDDCALLDVPHGHHLAVSTDMLLEGRHFLPDVNPQSLGHKALAVNLSDLAAMGARPSGCLLALGLPAVDDAWLSPFSQGFHELADEAGCPLVGGDTVRSPQGVVITVSVLGSVPVGQALRRDAAQVGDDIWLTGSLGAPGIALRLLDGRLPADDRRLTATRDALEWPGPPLAFAAELPGRARAAIDVSDGLLQDLSHVLTASGCSAVLSFDALPVHPAIQDLPADVLKPVVLTGGDVYQLCFTAAAAHRHQLQALARQHATPLSRIGTITGGDAGTIHDEHGHPLSLDAPGFDHFMD
ncbi:MAG TPA: thiamine-phosphate kinase [Burkholderiaceae bacterium]|nr:thiamine-phosphate kinase [Burkholderiaceae bacterium]